MFELINGNNRKSHVNKEKVHYLIDHLKNVSNLCKSFSEKFNMGTIGYNIGLIHDIGKIQDDFQRRINGENIKCRHAIVGAVFCKKFINNLWGRVYQYIVNGHHTGLNNYTSLDSSINNCINTFDKYNKEFEELNGELELTDDMPLTEKTPFNLHFTTRMLYSCLIDADRLDAEKSMNEDKYNLRTRIYVIQQLKDKFDDYMDKLKNNSANSGVNVIRNEILNHCYNASKNVPGIYTLTVGTGGGKTLSSMNYALNHSIEHKKDRIIYVIPYTSIIEQTASIFKKIFGEENVLEHHSNVIIEDDDNDEIKIRNKYSTENWDAPIIVTTTVQFFESLYSNKPSNCRKLHNIANSVVIIDEVQLLPIEYISSCANALNILTENFNSSVLLSTATQPGLDTVMNKFKTDINKKIDDIIPDPTYYMNKLRRVKINIINELKPISSWKVLSDSLNNHNQVLCVLNRKDECFTLRHMVKNSIELTADMCGEHRTNVINDIKRKLKNGEEIRVISTQLIEAGVDVDFPVVYRATTGIESIIQAGGRCNREGLVSCADMFVFEPPESKLMGTAELKRNICLRLNSKNNFSKNSMDNDLYIKEYFKCLFNENKNNKDDDIEKLLVCFPEYNEIDIKFSDACDNFKIINDDTVPILVPYKNGKNFIDVLKNSEYISFEFNRKIQRYIVNIRENELKRYMKMNLIIKCNNIYYLNNDEMYDLNCGLKFVSKTNERN